MSDVQTLEITVRGFFVTNGTGLSFDVQAKLLLEATPGNVGRVELMKLADAVREIADTSPDDDEGVRPMTRAEIDEYRSDEDEE